LVHLIYVKDDRLARAGHFILDSALAAKGSAVRQLTETDVDELEALLRDERAALLDTIRTRLSGRDEDEQRVLINYFSEGDSRAAAEQLAGTDIILLRQELAELEAIDTALKRLDFGAGGLCVKCGNPIPLARLRAAPASLTCLECQQRIEAEAGAARAPPAH
jgi:RNA polymerase-binding transcription factor DksA